MIKLVDGGGERQVQCPACGVMVEYNLRHQHSCHYKYMKQVRAAANEFEVAMMVSLDGGRRSWEQYGL
jgi:hypothetical protein